MCTQLDRVGITVVLTGGGAATVYAPSAYQSRDLDFVLDFWASAKSSALALRELGFTLEGQMYRHHLVPFTIDFLEHPIVVGSDVIGSDGFNTLRERDQILHILSPTNCVRDRLAKYLHWNDFSGLDQALAVARLHPVDLELIRDWCQREGEAAKFTNFARRLARPEPNG